MSGLAGLTGRSVRQVTSRPQFVAPVVVLPTLFLIAYAGGLAGALDLPGFPAAGSILDYQLGGVMLLSATMAGVMGGLAQAFDMQVHFLERLRVAPVRRPTIVVSRLIGTGGLALLGGIWFLVIGLIFGARVSAGIGGAVLLLVMVVLTAMAFGSVTTGVALASGKPNAVQGLFMLAIVLTMLSSAFFPRELLLVPLNYFAAVNPLSYVAESLQSLWFVGLEATPLLRGLAAIVVLTLVGSLLSAAGLRKLHAG